MATRSFLSSPVPYAVWVAVLLVAFRLTWTEPYTFGFTVMGLGAISAAVVVCGVVAAAIALRRGRRWASASIALACALIAATTIGALAALRSIRWA